MLSLSLVFNICLLVVSAAAFLIPGFYLGRIFRSPFPALTAFLGSCAILFNSVLLLDAFRLPLDITTVGTVLILWAVALHIWTRYRLEKSSECEPAQTNKLRGWSQLWLIPPAIAGTSLVARALIDPLSGWDNGIRWDYFARLILAQGSLDHYPPISSEDFSLYSWCDGIPPLVPILNFWIYAVTGSTAPILTAVRVVSEMGLAAMAVFKLSQMLWGPQAGWPALATLASSSLMLWSIAMGQETGLLTVSLLTLIILMERFRVRPEATLAGWAGVAAGVGAISREYGLAFVLLGGAILVTHRPSLRTLCTYAVIAGLTAGPWYLRNWFLTGNPLYPHSMAGLLPTNPIHVEMMRGIAAYCSVWAGYFEIRELPVVLTITGGAVGIMGTIGLIRLGRRRTNLLFAVLLLVGLWWWALPLTAGGWTYAHRVLTPGLAVLAACAGWIAVAGRAWRYVILGSLTVLSVDAARRTWLLPQYGDAAPLPYSLTQWHVWQDMSRRALAQRTERLWPMLISAAQGKALLVDHPAHHAEIVLRGGNPIPWFSPRVRSMFESGHSFDEIHQQLLAQKVRFVSVDRSSPMTAPFCRDDTFLGRLITHYRPNAGLNSLHVYDLDSLLPIQ